MSGFQLGYLRGAALEGSMEGLSGGAEERPRRLDRACSRWSMISVDLLASRACTPDRGQPRTARLDWPGHPHPHHLPPHRPLLRLRPHARAKCISWATPQKLFGRQQGTHTSHRGFDLNNLALPLCGGMHAWPQETRESRRLSPRAVAEELAPARPGDFVARVTGTRRDSDNVWILDVEFE